MSNEFSATAPQEILCAMPARHPLFVGGFGSAKTTALIIRALLDLKENSGTWVGVYEPTFDLIRLTVLPYFQSLLDGAGIRYGFNREKWMIEIPWGTIVLRSLDRPERIIGYETFSSHVDEIDTLKIEKAEEAWLKILGRNRQKNNKGETGRVWAYGTPEGYRFTYNRWGSPDRQDGYGYIVAPTYSNPHLPSSYIETLRASYPPDLVEAYIEGHWVNLGAGDVYPMFDRELNATDVEMRLRETLHIGQDFNVYAMASVIHVIRNGTPCAVAELTRLRDTAHMLESIDALYPEHAKIFYPDATGKAHKTVGATQSDLDLIRDAGHRVRAKSSNPAIKDRVVSMNAMFCNANEERRYFVNIKKCPKYTRALETHAYDDNGLPDKPGGPDAPDHLTDAGGYFIHYNWPVRKPKIREVEM